MIGWKSILPTFLICTVAVNIPLVQVLAQSLSVENIARLADKFVVQINGSNRVGGSGFIVRKNGGRYTVLTNHHVVESSTRYTVTMSDGQQYTVQNIKFLGNVDLAEIEFVSNRDYKVAPLSTNLGYSSGSKVYVYGFNTVSPSLTERIGQPLEGRITGSLSQGLGGYTLMMDLKTVVGMSGSPLLNEKGEVIGVYGSTDAQQQGEVKFLTLSLGIPIATYQRYANVTRPIPNNTVVAKTQTPVSDVFSLLVILSLRRVYVYRGNQIIAHYPVAIGRKGWETPVGVWYVMEKIKNPGWTNPKTGQVFKPGDKKNLLGERWIGFWADDKDTIGFNGTYLPQSVENGTTNGNLRMYDRDVKELFEFVKVGTTVQVVD
jgi:lipoprotein-anchoring transpeptidase ErfK/SrfK